MDLYKQNEEEEKVRLKSTLKFIEVEMAELNKTLARRKEELLTIRTDMWENTAHSSNDFTKLTEMNQYLAIENNQVVSCQNTVKEIDKYQKMLSCPYFGRFDFIEEGTKEKEEVYVGMYNVMDLSSFNILVYDWRAAISSIFYEHELGNASYQAPSKIIAGKVKLKRQYKIYDSELKYFFDCSLKIDDEMLQQVLSGNASPKMRNIVNTIQKEQNSIIRDLENELLIVQGVAGSGKTSIALHRIAYLLYQGMNQNLKAKNMLIISPNKVFGRYISGVLPELGEENVQQMTFDDIVSILLQDRLMTEKSVEQLEALVSYKNQEDLERRQKSINFKGSKIFVQILNRMLQYYERNLISFEDIYFQNQIIITKQLLKARLINDKTGRPLAKRLKAIEENIFKRIHPLRRERLKKIEDLVQNVEGRDLEIKAFSRLLSIKEAKRLLKIIRRFTEIDYVQIYHMLFADKELLFRLAGDLKLPNDIEHIVELTREDIEGNVLRYEDCAPLLYLKLKVEGSDAFSGVKGIKHVVIDEAQDYLPLHYQVFNTLFRDARYTVLGDVHQAVNGDTNLSIYDKISDILSKRTTTHLSLNKGYRSSYEISSFTQRILNLNQDYESIERHEAHPEIIHKHSTQSMDDAVVSKVKDYIKQGYETIAIICKSTVQSKALHNRLKDFIPINLINSTDKEVLSGVMIIPGYLAKGLEFDVVLVYDVSSENYWNERDKNLLYISCTRALHRLVLYYTGNKSSYIPS